MAFSYKKQTHKSKGRAGRIPHPVGASPHSGARKNKLTAAFKAREDKVRPRKKKAPKAIPTIKPRSGPTKRRPTMKEQLKDSGVAIDYDQLDKMQGGGKVMKKNMGGSLKAVNNPGLAKLPTPVRNKMGYAKAGGKVKGYKKGGPITYRMSGGQVVGNSYD
jgi:hypothetical protein